MKNRKSILIPVLTVFMLPGLCANATSAEAPGCSAAARSLFLACGFDNKDDYLVQRATCLDTNGDTGDCLDEAGEALSEGRAECAEVRDARLELCGFLADAAHVPEFGEDFVDHFVDPLQIGVTIDPNPWFPLVQGYEWVYEGTSVDEETDEEVTEVITVTVTSQLKNFDGVKCLTVRDVVAEDEEVMEITDDWYAQDVEGNLWYCGEISQNFEFFEGDDPEEAELVDLDGSWKALREGDEAGILLPFAPEVGSVIRQELSYTDAEDVIEILALDGDESSAVASCNGGCLVTRDFTPLEPGEEENKFYVSGIGLIIELKPGTDERVELIEFTQ